MVGRDFDDGMGWDGMGGGGGFGLWRFWTRCFVRGEVGWDGMGGDGMGRMGFGGWDRPLEHHGDLYRVYSGRYGLWIDHNQ